jgi:hypothetical protein
MNILHLDGKRYKVLSHVMYDKDNEYGYPSARMSLLPLPDEEDEQKKEIERLKKEVDELQSRLWLSNC